MQDFFLLAKVISKIILLLKANISGKKCILQLQHLLSILKS